MASAVIASSSASRRSSATASSAMPVVSATSPCLAAALVGRTLAEQIENDTAHHLADVGEERRAVAGRDGTAAGELDEAVVNQAGGVELAVRAALVQLGVGQPLQGADARRQTD